LGYAIIEDPPNGHLAPGDRADKPNIYLRDNATGNYYTLSLEESIGAPGSDPTTRPVVFSTPIGLFPGLEENFSSVYTYEWDDGHIELASVEPDGDPFPEGASLEGWREANGVRRVVMKEREGSGQLYLRTVDATGAHTVEISASQRSIPDPEGPSTTNFWMMSPDGSKILFSAREALTDDAPIGGFTSLYLFDATTHALTNVTASALGNQLLIYPVGMSPDGSYVYFSSVGRFHPGENDADEAALFAWHNGEVTQIGPPQGDYGTAEVQNRAEYSGNRTSPDGRFFTFTTRKQVTAYDNTDQSAETDSGDPRPDTEVYVYDAV
jgi:hypothetical protein